MKKQYYYRIFCLNSDATAEEIKKAYRKLALRFHPDKNPGNHFAENKFKEVSVAYQTLINHQKKRIYDSTSNSETFSDFRGNFSSGYRSYGGFTNIFEEIFHDFFPPASKRVYYESGMKLKKCRSCSRYTLKESCGQCGKKSSRTDVRRRPILTMDPSCWLNDRSKITE